jgi:hypothetical protein
MILTFGISFNVSSQVWIQPGAVWHYETISLGSVGFIKVEYEKDTIIANKLCNKLKAVNYVFGILDPNGTFGLAMKEQLKANYTYCNGDTVFYLVNDKFQILYNFGAKPGDTWNLGVSSILQECPDSSVKVDSIGTITINSKSYRWISVSPTQYSGISLRGKIIERIGAVAGYLFPGVNCCDPNMQCDLGVEYFRCFQDDNFPLYNVSNKDCEHYLKTNITAFDSFKGLYPVPTKDKLNLGSNNIVSVKIISMDGVVQCEPEVIRNQIDLSDFKSGIYLVVMKDKQGRIHTHKAIKE